MKKWTVQVHVVKNMTRRQRNKVFLAIETLEKVVNSPKFKQAILDAFLSEAMGKTNRQVWKEIMSGSDKFHSEADADFDLYLTGFRRWFSRVVGYTYGNTAKIWINKKMLLTCSAGYIAGNLMHEYLHNLGFNHFKNKSTSVPYVIGNIVRKLAKEIAK